MGRLNYLTEIGLAERSGPLTWNVRQDFDSALGSFQRAQDRQKMLAQHTPFLSDPRLQFRVVTADSTAEIDGRVIAHVLDQVSDRPHALIEGVDGIVYYVPHDFVIAEARANGKVRPNAFVRFRTEIVGGLPGRRVEDLGDADQLLSDRAYLRGAIPGLVQRGILDAPAHCWSGWLGRYHQALRDEARSGAEMLRRSSGQCKETARGR